MDPRTIAGITIGALAGALVLGNVGREIHSRYKKDKKERKDKIQKEIEEDFTNNNSELYRDPKVGTAHGRGKKHSFKKTRKQNKRK
jgi:L-serine deaminase